MLPCDKKVDFKNGKTGQDSLDKSASIFSPRLSVYSMNPNQEFRCGNHGDVSRLLQLS